MGGLKSNEVYLVAYDAGWPRLFACEAAELRLALGALALKVEHIGSTAVPGLASKPIVDVAVETESFEDLPEIEEAFASLGYVAKGEFGLPGRQFFTKGDPVLFHVHVVESGSPHWQRWMKFRDALRADGSLRDRYAAMKQDLAAKFANDRPAYTAAKNDFIERVVSG